MVRQDADTIPHGTTPGHKDVARKLTPQQRMFAVEVASGMTQRDAAIAAGYSKTRADQTGCELRKKPSVAAEIHRIQSKPINASLGSKAECLDKLWRGIELAENGQDSTALARLSELWLKANGMLIEKREIRQDSVCEIEWSSATGGDADAH